MCLSTWLVAQSLYAAALVYRPVNINICIIFPDYFPGLDSVSHDSGGARLKPVEKFQVESLPLQTIPTIATHFPLAWFACMSETIVHLSGLNCSTELDTIWQLHLWFPMTHCVRSVFNPRRPYEKKRSGGLTPSWNMHLLPTYEERVIHDPPG